MSEDLVLELAVVVVASAALRNDIEPSRRWKTPARKV